MKVANLKYAASLSDLALSLRSAHAEKATRRRAHRHRARASGEAGVIRVVLILAAGLAFGMPSPARTAQALVFPLENVKSCANWLTSEEAEDVGKLWLYGFWSGLNAAKNSRVGHTTDVDGVVAQVKLLCQQEPSTSLIIAAYRTYVRFDKEGK